MHQIFDVSGKIVLVTGGGSGIGLMIARGFVEAGATVYIASRNVERLNAAAADLSAAGRCEAIPADLSTVAGVEALAAEMSTRAPRLDVLVNNAGAFAIAEIDSFSEEMWDSVMDLNAKAVFFTTQKLLPLLRNSASAEAPARIINIASIAALETPPFEAFSYSASKAACVALTKHLAKRLAPEHILANVIAPGPFATDMTAPLFGSGDDVAKGNPLRRLGSAEDAAGCALFLASRASAWVTGAVIPCDGGHVEIGGA
jgi:NAD(P)-dependent dehydrogenase (short-subunit alcohol dehydrogenase family)